MSVNESPSNVKSRGVDRQSEGDRGPRTNANGTVGSPTMCFDVSPDCPRAELPGVVIDYLSRQSLAAGAVHRLCSWAQGSLRRCLGDPPPRYARGDTR